MIEVRLLYYIDEQNYAIQSSHVSDCLDKQLLQYAKDIGVMGYSVSDKPSEPIKWNLQDKWYTTQQIKRMLKLRAFL